METMKIRKGEQKDLGPLKIVLNKHLPRAYYVQSMVVCSRLSSIRKYGPRASPRKSGI